MSITSISSHVHHIVKIVAIGGGDMGGGQTLEIDQEIVSLAGHPAPKAVFLPTASFDARDYWDRFDAVYGASLGCTTQPLFLWNGYTSDEIQETIETTKWNPYPHRWEFRGDADAVQIALSEADIIYVGGGNTRRMIELWRSAGIDQMLLEAGERGAVLCGLSAGCICWAQYGNSDFALTENLGRPTMRTDCLGFLPLAMCPHVNSEPFRLQDFKDMMRSTPGVGLGLDDCCALEVVDERFRVIACADGATAHRVTAAHYEKIEPFSDYRGLDELVS